jgi:hypothetical protein
VNKENQATTVKLMSMKIHNAVQGQKVKIICRSVFGSLLASLGFLTPAFAFAQSYAVTSVPSLFSIALGILNGYVVPIIFAIAFIMFLFGVYVNFIAPGASEEASKKGGQFVIWSIIGFVLMFSIWGLINIFINTFALQNNQPTLPGFGVPASSSLTNSSNSLGSLFSGLLGGGGTVGGTVTYPSTTNGLPYMVQPTNGVCPSGYTLYSTTCINNTAAGGYGTGNTNAAGGTGSGSGSIGASCTNNTQCSGNYVCDASTDTCQVDGPNTFSCSDDSTPNASTGLCANGQSPTNTNGAEAPSDGSVGNGGSCAGNQQACSSGECNTTTGQCQAIPQNGAVGSGGSCLGNENACQNGLTCNNDTDTCTPDSNVNNGNTTVSCNDGTTQDANVGCGNDGGAAGSSDQSSQDQTCTDGSTAGAGGCISCNSQGNTSSTQSGCDSINSSLEQGDSYDYNDCTLDGSC